MLTLPLTIWILAAVLLFIGVPIVVGRVLHKRDGGM